MLKLLLIASVETCDLYLFHIISLVNPDFKLVNNLISSSLDKATTGIYNVTTSIIQRVYKQRVLHLLEHYLFLQQEQQVLFVLN